MQADGKVWEWESGKPKRIEGFAGAVAVAVSPRHSVALKSDGAVWVWGDHGAGDLGNGEANWSSEPLQLRGLSDITAVAASYQLTVALKKDGTVWAVGYGTAGGLGDGVIRNFSATPVKASGLTGVKALAPGYMHVVALKGDGTVWSWGYNHEHQLGNPSLNAEESARPVRSGMLSGVVAIAAAASHSAAVTAEGVVWAWGQNDAGSLGVDPETLARSDVPLRVGQPVPAECRVLFSCGTASGKFIRICGTEDESDVAKWSAIHYRFGPETGPPELMYPENPERSAAALFFSHEDLKSDYRVTVRFDNGGYTYRVYSGSESGAGVDVLDAKGRKVSGIACSERPEIYIDYLRTNLPCDPKSPRGAAACK
jgi:alpha-tubulin suppressor-like RCC1 family protein